MIVMMNNPKKSSGTKSIETNPEGLANKILQVLKVNDGEDILFSVTKGGHVLIQKESSAQPDTIRRNQND